MSSDHHHRHRGGGHHRHLFEHGLEEEALKDEQGWQCPQAEAFLVSDDGGQV
jgi:hypothetical protein